MPLWMLTILATPFWSGPPTRETRLIEGPWSVDLHGLFQLAVTPGEMADSSIRRARLATEAKFPAKLSFIGQVDLVPEPDPSVLDAKIAWTGDPVFLSLGLGKVVFGRQNLLPISYLQFPERADALRTEGGVVPDRRLGGEVASDLGLLAMALGLYWGAPGLPPDGDGGWLLSSRIELRPVGPIVASESNFDVSNPWYDWGRLLLGGSFYHEDTGSLVRNGLGADLGLMWKGLSLSGEIVWAKAEEEKDIGTVFQLGWFVWPGIVELAGRYGRLSDLNEIAVGSALWLFSGRVRLQLWQRRLGETSLTRLDLVAWF